MLSGSLRSGRVVVVKKEMKGALQSAYDMIAGYIGIVQGAGNNGFVCLELDEESYAMKPPLF